MARRDLLHRSKLGEFKAWLKERGWVEAKTKDFYEVLRMVHPREVGVLLIHERPEAPEHYTVWGLSEKQFHIWQRFKKPQPAKPKPAFDPLQI